MALTRLQDDLMNDFAEQKSMIYEQLDVFDPLGEQLSKPAAIRLVSKGVLILTEISCYMFSLGSLASLVFLNKIFPFTILPELRYNKQYSNLGWMNIEAFNMAIYGIVAVMALLFFFIAVAVRSIRLKNDILHFAGKNIKTMVGQHLKRKAAIEMINQRHFHEIQPLQSEGISHIVSLNDIPNPGYNG